MLICYKVMMLMMPVAISCRGVTPWSSPSAAENVGCRMLLQETVTRTSVTRDKETAHVPGRRRFYIARSSDASSPFHHSISFPPQAPDLNSSLFSLYHWDMYNPISTGNNPTHLPYRHTHIHLAQTHTHQHKPRLLNK